MQSPARRIPIRLTPFSVFGFLLAIAGCGTIAVDIRTEIVSRQEITQNIEYVITGPIAALLITDGEVDLGAGADLADLETVKAAGWDLVMEVTQIDEEDALVMRLSQTFKGEDAAEQFRIASQALAESDTTTSMVPLLEITDSEDEVIYELRISVSADERAEPAAGTQADDFALPTVEALIIDGTPFPGLPDFSDSGTLDGFDGFEDAFTDGFQDFTDALESSFDDFITMNWTVEMPGRVQETNATSQDGGKLTWELNFSDISDAESDLFVISTVNKKAGGSCNL